MKKLRLLMAFCTLFLIGGGNFAKADTSLLTAENGWTKITELPTNVSLYYFTIVDNSQDLMLTLSRGLNNQQTTAYNGLFYATSANPLVDKSKLFSLEKDGDNYVMRNVEYNGYFLQTEYNAAHFYRTHDNGGGDKSWGHIKFTYANSVWTIQNAKYPVDNGNYLGMWEDANPANGKSLALNKANDKKGTFQIYSILKTDVDAYYASLKIANAEVTPETPVDMTGLIVNPNARFWTGSIPFGWTTTGTQNVNNGNGYDQFPGIFEFSDWNAGNWTGSLKQTITVPNGKFRLKAAIMAATGVTAHLTANSDKSDNLVPIGDSGGNINPDGTETTMGDGQRGYKYLTVETIVTTGSLELGAYGEASAAHLWVNADNFTLSYLDPFISALATEITAASPTSLTAGGWYKFTAASSDNYSFDASAVGDIIYTDADQLNSVATGTAATAVVALTEGTTYYIKSASEQTLTITPQTFTYVIGDGTPSVADDQYTQNKTFTLTFADCSTDDPNATFQLLDASKITVNGAAATASVTGKVLTITLADALSTSTNYAISIAAGAVGYKADAANDEITLTVHTPAVFDGTYFIASTDGTQFVSRGGNSNTEATLDQFGIAVNVSTDGNNVTMLQLIDNERYIFGGSQTIYTDRTASDDNVKNYGKWTVAAVSGGYSLYNTGREKYIAAGKGKESPYADAATYADAAYAWTLVAPATHAALMATYKDANAAEVAAAAGLSATTVADLETILTGADYTPESVTPTNAYPTVSEQYQPKGYTEKIIEQEYSGLKNGIYKVKLSAFHRIKTNAATYACSQNNTDNPTSYLYANDQKVQLPSVMSEYRTSAYTGGNDPNYEAEAGKNYPNNTNAAGTAFDEKKYIVEVFAVVTDGTLKLGLTDPGKYTSATWQYTNWICYKDLAITYYGFNSGDYTALDSEITTAEGKTLGFDNGEYAPYTNVAALTTLANAKAMNTAKDAPSQTIIDKMTTALHNATWTANVGEMNAVYWADYTSGDIAGDGYIHPLGWTNTGYNTRIYSEAAGNKDTNTGISAVNNLAMMSKYNTTYGETTGYTMPLKAATIYKITFKYCGWGNDPTTNIVLTDPESNTITLAPGFKPATNNGNTNAENWYSYTGYFVSTTAGNYVLAMNKVESGQQQIGIGDIELVSASEIVFADGSVPTYAPGTYPSVKITRNLTANRWATGVYPFAINKSAVGEIAVLARYNSEAAIIGFDNAASSTANVPFLMRSTTTKNEITLSNVAVAAASATNAEAGDASLVGSYANNTAVAENEGNYILSNNTIYPVGDDVTVNAYRAYINIADTNHARALRFVVGEITGVDNVEAATEATLKDGKYLENGKVVIVKNGKKFNANGQQVK